MSIGKVEVLSTQVAWLLCPLRRQDSEDLDGFVWTEIALCFPFLLLYGLGLPSGFCSEYYTSLGLLSCFLFQVLYEFGTVFLIEYYCYALGPILLARVSNVLIFCLI